jgi:hypothetical protein
MPADPSTGLSLRAYGASHGSHSHAHHQMLVGLQGVLELEIEGHARRVAAGDAVLVAAGERHDFGSAQGSRCLVLDSADPLWLECGVLPSAAPQVHALARYLVQAMEARLPLATLHGRRCCWKPGVRARRRAARGDASTGRRWACGCSRDWTSRSRSPNSRNACTWAPASSPCAATKRRAWGRWSGCGCSGSRERGSCATPDWR